MMTWYLWRRLRHPPHRHPIYRRFKVPPPPDVRGRENFIPRAVLRLSIIVAFVALFLFSPTLFFTLLIGSITALPAAFLLLNGTLFGAYWAVTGSGVIARTYHNHFHDLLAVLPMGGIGANWLLALSVVYRDDSLRQLHLIVRVLTLIVLGVLLLMALFLAVIMLTAPTTPLGDPAQIPAFAASVAPFTAAILILYCDHVQSIVTGGLIALLLPHVIRDPLQCRLWAGVVFITLQLVAYMLVLVMVLLVATLIDAVRGADLWAGVLQAVATVLIFYVVREALIEILMRLILRWNQASPAEWENATDR